jgi:hypothetical protein
LPAVVRNQAVTVRGAVVFDHEALLRVVEVGAPGEQSVLAVKRHLRLGPRQAGADERQSQPRLHRALRGGFDVVRRPTQARQAFEALVCIGPFAELRLGDQPAARGHVEQDYGLHERLAPRDVGKRPHARCHRESATGHTLAGRNV